MGSLAAQPRVSPPPRVRARRRVAATLLALALAALGVAAGAAAAAAGPGSLLAFGNNLNGQLGSVANSGTNTANPIPALVGLPGQDGAVTQSAVGSGHSLVVTASGQLFAFGYNFFGQLGSAANNGTHTPNPTPTLVSLPEQDGAVTQVATGSVHSLAATASGQLYAFGDNFFGELGSAANNSNPVANPVPALVTLPGQIGPVTQVAAGDQHSLVVTASGQLFAFGYNFFGQLGRANSGNAIFNPTPAQVGLLGQVGPVTQVAAGAEYSLAVTASGQLYAFGRNDAGQLGSGATDTANPVPALVSLPGQVGPVTQVAAGGSHSLVVTASGQLYAFGRNSFGQLGSEANIGTNTANPVPALVSLPGQVGPVTQVAAGLEHSLAVTASGQLYAFGLNDSGQLGSVPNSGTATANPTPVLVAAGPDTSIGTVARGPEANYSLVVVGDLAISNDALPPAQAGVPYRAQLEASGGAGSLRWEAQGLPAGLGLDPARGVIAGTPQAPGAYPVSISVSDAEASQIGRSLTLVVAPAPAPAIAGLPGGPAAALALSPRLSALHQSARLWRLGRALPRLSPGAQATAQSSGAPLGTTFSFRLDQAARVRLSFARLVPGRRTGRQCRAGGGRGRRCLRALPAGTLSLSAPAGPSRLIFQGRLSPRAMLRPGAYRLAIRASNTAGLASAPQTLSFRAVSSPNRA